MQRLGEPADTDYSRDNVLAEHSWVAKGVTPARNDSSNKAHSALRTLLPFWTSAIIYSCSTTLSMSYVLFASLFNLLS